MFYDHHFIGMHWIWWLLVAGFILLIIFNMLPYRTASASKEDALDILKMRYARGEIEQEEFEERKRVLLQSK